MSRCFPSAKCLQTSLLSGCLQRPLWGRAGSEPCCEVLTSFPWWGPLVGSPGAPWPCSGSSGTVSYCPPATGTRSFLLFIGAEKSNFVFNCLFWPEYYKHTPGTSSDRRALPSLGCVTAPLISQWFNPPSAGKAQVQSPETSLAEASPCSRPRGHRVGMALVSGGCGDKGDPDAATVLRQPLPLSRFNLPITDRGALSLPRIFLFKKRGHN